MCLLIGCTGVGKTLLLKRLNSCSNRSNYTDVGEPPATIPTVGTNLVNVVTSRKAEVTVRELGGCMAPIWHNYFKDCNAVMFMLDMSNRVQISSSCVMLMEVLSSEHLKSAVVLLILNKIDVPSAMKRVELENILRLEEVIKYAPQKVTVCEASARDGKGLQDIAKWIQDNGKPGS